MRLSYFSWKITGFADHRDEFYSSYHHNDVLKSREFTVKDPDGKDTMWMLECIPRFETDSVKVSIISRNKFDVKAKVQLSIINCDDERVRTNNDYTSSDLHKFSGTSTVEVFSMSYEDELNPYSEILMPNGDLSFDCELTIIGSFESKIGNVLTEPTDPSLKVCENLGEFYLSEELSDVLIECHDKTFEAHQIILSARSPVFRSMFQADMKEKKGQLVEIKDIEPNVVSEMLKFIYTGSCVATEESPDLDTVSDLLEASDKYQMVTLKNVCQNLLSSSLEVENSLKFLVLADMYGAQELKDAAMDIVINNLNSLMKTEEWRECKQKRPHIFSEIAEAIALGAS